MPSPLSAREAIVMERIDLVGTGRRIKRTLWLGALLALGAFILLLCVGQALHDAGDRDGAALAWFASAPMFLLAVRAFFYWSISVVIGWLIATRRD